MVLRASDALSPLFAALSLLCSAGALAQSAPTARADGDPAAGSAAAPPVADDALTEPTTASRSVGLPDMGRLEDGVSLDETRGLRLRNGPGGRWGTAELVGLIQRSAAAVQDASPGPPLLGGHLSSPRGGPLRPHQSHQSGRDADLGFYVTDENGAPVDVEAMVRLDHLGCGRTRNGPVCIDGRRTFLLIAAMVRDPHAQVQWILLSPGVREQVLASGRRLDVTDEVLELVRTVTRPRRGSEAHDDHLHVRIYCPVDDRPRCQDRGPFHALYRGVAPSSAP